MPFYNLRELEQTAIGPSYSTAHGSLVHGQNLEVALVRFQAHRGAKPHSHPNEQMMYVLKGRLQARIGDEHVVAEPGDIIHMPANVEHEVLALDEDVEVISVKNLVDGKGSPRG